MQGGPPPHPPCRARPSQAQPIRTEEREDGTKLPDDHGLPRSAKTGPSSPTITACPRQVPAQVIVERFSRSNLPEMEKRKYLVPCDMPVGQFIFILRSRLHLSPGTALFVFVSNTLPQTGNLMGSVYDSYKDKEDGFLYMCYSSEKTFG
ncbi:autophagy-related protein 8h [Hordeum vulgare]|nr:autophagy-related protein 8h [Hordeum vulgare]